MSLAERLFATALDAARFLKNDNEPMRSFDHDEGSIAGWYVCTTDKGRGVGWTAQTDVILTSKGELYSLYIRTVSRADKEDRTPCRSLRLITKDDPAWPDSQERALLKTLKEMMA